MDWCLEHSSNCHNKIIIIIWLYIPSTVDAAERFRIYNPDKSHLWRGLRHRYITPKGGKQAEVELKFLFIHFILHSLFIVFKMLSSQLQSLAWKTDMPDHKIHQGGGGHTRDCKIVVKFWNLETTMVSQEERSNVLSTERIKPETALMKKPISRKWRKKFWNFEGVWSLEVKRSNVG